MIMVDIYFPTVDEVYNLRVDENIKILYLIQEISEMMGKKYKSAQAVEADKFMLCTVDEKRILENDKTLAMYDIKNGGRLMMV